MPGGGLVQIQERDQDGLSGGLGHGVQKWTDLTGTHDRVKIRCGRTRFWLGQLDKTEDMGKETILGLGTDEHHFL